MVGAASSLKALIELDQDPALAALVRNWDFSPGKRFEAEVVRKLLCSVHHPSSSQNGSFFMLVVFRRYLCRLTEDSVRLWLSTAAWVVHLRVFTSLTRMIVTIAFWLLTSMWASWFAILKESQLRTLTFIFTFGVMVGLIG